MTEDVVGILPHKPQIEAFNVVTGLIFHSLYQDFPVRQVIRAASLGKPLDDLCETPEETRVLPSGIKQMAGETYIRHSNIPPTVYLEEILAWLEAEGFIRSTPRGDYSPPSYQITRQTFTILGNAPEGITERLGTRLDRAVQSVGKEAGKAAVSEVVGRIIGATLKSWTQQ